MEIEKRILKIDNFISSSDECFAHLSEDGKNKETMREHTERCQKYWRQIVGKKNLNHVFEKFEKEYLEGFGDETKEIFELMTANIVTIHDVGKVNPIFQKNKMNHSWHQNCLPNSKIGSKHSILSAVFFLDYFINLIRKAEKEEMRISATEAAVLKNLAYIDAYIISRHHGALNEFERFVNSVAGQETTGENVGAEAREWLKVWKLETEVGIEDGSFIIKWKQLRRQMKKTNQEASKKAIFLYGLTRLLYSLLVVSDYYATTEFMSGLMIYDFGEIEDIQKLMNAYEDSAVQKSIRTYEQTVYPMRSDAWLKENEINVLRTEMFLDAERILKANLTQPVYYLEAPTGSGKTNAAMNLSFTLMQADPEIKKIFYIYPFNTLVEQNLDSIKRVFGDQEAIMSQVAVVNSLVPLKVRNEDEDWSKILLDRQFLNYPIVLSTHVMLFRTLFGNAKEDVFAFHQLNHSVIVLDEIQSYRNDLWSEMINFFKSFAELLHLKIIIMSATLPNLEILTDNCAETVQLISSREKYFNHPKFADRVIPKYDLLDENVTLEFLAEHIETHTSASGNVLVEFIKKSRAEEFYQLMKESSERKIYLMTGDSSIQDRKKLIQTVREEKGIVLIATQVIEAGVDIDMDIGYKDISRLDSEEQFMGRINRSGRKKGIVYFFNLDDARKIYGSDDIRTNEENTLVHEEIRQLLTTKNFPQFYEDRILTNLKKRKSKADDNNLQDFFEKRVGLLDMPAINKKMQLIDDNRQIKNVYLGRVIQNDDGQTVDGRELWEKYKLLLQDNEMSYAEKKVKLHDIRTFMNSFIYQVGLKALFQEDEQIGDLYYIENGEPYFDENGILIRTLFEEGTDLFI